MPDQRLRQPEGLLHEASRFPIDTPSCDVRLRP
jgi:hypothetical protein